MQVEAGTFGFRLIRHRSTSCIFYIIFDSSVNFYDETFLAYDSCMADTVQQIKDRLNIVDVVSQYTKLDRAGQRLTDIVCRSFEVV